MPHREEAKQVSSSRRQLEHHSVEALVPAEAWHLEALVHPAAFVLREASALPAASAHLSASRPRVAVKRLSSFRLREAYLPEALAHPAELVHQGPDRARARRREGYQARGRLHLQQASCLPGNRDQIFLALFM